MTTPQPPTLDELRDWHAERAGWKYIKRSFNEEEWFRTSPFGEVATHPFPPTLDGAASAMPEGVRFERHFCRTMNRWEWNAWHREGGEWIMLCDRHGWSVSVPDTGNEVYDRYLLAQRAHEAEVGK